MTAPAVLVVGEALVDVTQAPGRPDVKHPGGSPMNVAVGLARLGVPTTLATHLGSDDHGDRVRAHLTDSGVRLAPTASSGPTATATARLDADGQATYEFDLRWELSELPDPAGYALLHVGSIGAWMPPGADAVAELVAQARAAGVAVSFDPNVRLALAPDPEAVGQRVRRLAAAAQIVKLSDEDAATLGGGTGAIVDELLGLGPALVALTRGSDGALLMSESDLVEIPAGDIVVADTIGAGDAWMAALLAGLVTRRWTDCAGYSRGHLQWLGAVAAAAAAITCSRPGADPPWRRELPQLDERTTAS
jgi:fructokinase